MSKQSDIKIFVSHRIDKNSETIKNPLFINVRCGAVYDRTKSPKMIGDDTGDNISDKREKYCELTIHYWAWKNQAADYYGFCHYRRYLSFANRDYPENAVGCVEHPCLDEVFLSRFNINQKSIRTEIEGSDLIIANYVPVEKTGDYSSVYDYCKKNPQGYKVEHIDTLYSVVAELYPEYLQDVKDFFAGKYNCWYNCYVMKSDLFNEYSTWLFSILFELEKRLDMSSWTQEQLRFCGVMAERLLGAYVERLKRQGDKIIKFKQLVFIQDTSTQEYSLPVSREGKRDIVIPFDNSEVPFVAATIASIKKFDITGEFQFILLAYNISARNRHRLTQYLGDCQHVWIDTQKIVCKYQRACPLVDPSVINKVAIFEVCSNLSSVLYVRPGIIFKDSLTELFEEKVPSNLAYACLNVDAFVNSSLFESIVPRVFSQKWKTVNGIVPLYSFDLAWFNVKKTLSIFSPLSILEVSRLLKNPVSFDSLLNLRLREHIGELSLKWFGAMNEPFIVDPVRWRCPNWLNNKFLEGIRHPGIFNLPKYWYYGSVLTPHMEAFWTSIRNTVFYDDCMIQFSLVCFDQKNSQAITGRHKNRLRMLADKYFPINSRRRQLLKAILPSRGSRLWSIFRKIYFQYFE